MDSVLSFIAAWPTYKKAIVPVVTAVLAVAAVLLGADSEWVIGATAILTALGVYKTANSGV